jgi:hypothetical protein
MIGRSQDVLVQLQNATFHWKAHDKRTDPPSKLVLGMFAVWIDRRVCLESFSIDAHAFELSSILHKKSSANVQNSAP